MKRWELMKFTNRAGVPDGKMTPSDSGEFVRYEDIPFADTLAQIEKLNEVDGINVKLNIAITVE
jgi:hypothetical protein